MAATAGLSLTLDPMGKMFPLHKKRFFSETTRTVETKLPRNDHWKVLYKFFVFYADRKSKMAATAIPRLTLDPMEQENVQMPSSQKLQILLKPNCT